MVKCHFLGSEILSFARSPAEMKPWHLGSPYIPQELLQMRPRKDSGGSTFVHKHLISVSLLKKGVTARHSRALRPCSLQCVWVCIAFVLHNKVVSGNWDQNPHFDVPVQGPNGFLPVVGSGFVFAQSHQHSTLPHGSYACLGAWHTCVSSGSNWRTEFSPSEDK